MTLPVLYSFRRCPYAIRARLAIQASRFECQLREVLLRDKPPEMIAASPKATVPVLILPDDRIIDESLDIMLHVLGINDPYGWLDSELLHDGLEMIKATETQFKPHLDQYKYASREEDPRPEYHRQIAGEFLYALDARLATSRFLSGEKMLLADAAILPFVRQFAQTDRPWFDDQKWSNLHRWLKAFEGSDLRLSVMNKYPAWKPHDADTIFPPS